MDRRSRYRLLFPHAGIFACVRARTPFDPCRGARQRAGGRSSHPNDGIVKTKISHDNAMPGASFAPACQCTGCDWLEIARPGRGPDGASALDFQIFGRALAAIGNLLILDRLPLVEAREPGFLHCGDMNENVFAPRCGLNESIALGRVEPLDGAFSHTLPPRDRNQLEQAVSAGRLARTNRICRLRWTG